MAQTESKIKLIFDGVERGVAAAAAKAERAVKSLDDKNSKLAKSSDAAGSGLLKVGKGLLAIGGAGSAVQTIGGVAGAVAQLAPAALILPGVLLSGAAAMTTFKIATSGFGDALKAGLSGDMKKFAESTKDMAPAMSDAAKSVVKFKPEIDELKKKIQGKFWAGFSGEIQSLGKGYLPMLKTQLGNVSAGLGQIAFNALSAANTPFFKGAVKSILQDTSDTLDNFAPVVGNVLTGFIGIGKVGTRFLPGLTAGVDTLTGKFAKWVEQNSEVGGKLEHWISQGLSGFGDLIGIIRNVGSIAVSVFKGLGGAINSPLERLNELTAKVDEFLKTASAQDGLRALGDMLRTVGEVVQRVLLTALKELAPTLVAIAPTVKVVATTLGDLLVRALELAGPLLRGIADILNRFPGVVSLATTAVVGFVVAVKMVQATNAVLGVLDDLGINLGKAGAAAEGAEGKVSKFRLSAGLLKGLGVGLALTAIAVAMDDINVKAAGGAQNLKGFQGELHDIVEAGKEVATLDFSNIGRQFSDQMAQTVRNIQSGQSAFGKFLGWINQKMSEPLPPLTFDVKTGPAQAQVDSFIAGVNKSTGTVNINGNDNPAGFALREIIREIDAGKGTVRIDGQDMPAQEALKYVVGLINNSRGTVTINGQNVPAGQALADILSRTNNSRGTIQVGANTSSAQGIVDSFIRRNDGRTIHIFTSVLGSGGIASAGRLASGGPVRGPGTGTSDTAGLFALSNGEYVATARQVDNAGGPNAFGRLMAALDRGPVSGLADGGAIRVPPATPAMSAASSSGGVRVTFAGNTSDALATVIMRMVRTGRIQLQGV